MGYDFSEMEWEIDEANSRISIKKIPEIKILSNCTDINYYNMENGIFNKFKPEDLNLIKDQCTSQIEQVAWQSELPHAALEQANVLLAEIGKIHKWEITPLKLLDAQG